MSIVVVYHLATWMTEPMVQTYVIERAEDPLLAMSFEKR